MRLRLPRFRSWVFRLAQRWFPWLVRFRHTPIVNDENDIDRYLRHRPNLLELERRQAPTMLSVSSLALPPAALAAGLGAQTQPPPQAKTRGRLASPPADADPAAAEPLAPALPAPPAAPVDGEALPAAAAADDGIVTVPPAEDLQPMWVDTVLSADYLQALPAADAPFQDLLATEDPAQSQAKQARDEAGADAPAAERSSPATSGGSAAGAPGAASPTNPGAPAPASTTQPPDQNPPPQPPRPAAGSQVPSTLPLTEGAAARSSPSLDGPAAGASVLASADPLSVSPDAAQVSPGPSLSEAQVPSNGTAAPGTNAASGTPALLGFQTPTAPLGGLSHAATPTVGPSAVSSAPIVFQASQGQSGSAVRFVSDSNGYQLSLSANAATLVLPAPTDNAGTATSLTMQFVGGTAGQVVGLDPLPAPPPSLPTPATSGSTPAQPQAPAASYGEVEYRNVYAGINLDFYGNAQGQLEYTWTVAAGAHPGAIRLAFQGAQAASIDAQGDLHMQTGSGAVVEHAPVLYQDINGVRHSVAGQYVQLGPNQIGFQVGTYDHTQALVIDPTLSTLTASGTALNAVEGTPFTGTVATFTDSDPNTTPADYQARIDWGDGQTSTGTISANGSGNFTVTGSHTFAEEGSPVVTSTISDAESQVTAQSPATVNEAPLVATGGSALTGTEGTPLVNQVVATFQDPGGAEPLPVAVSDAGFEQPSVGAGTFQYTPTGTAWAFSGGAGVAGNGSGFTSNNPNAPEGSQVGFLQNTGSSITQTLAFDVAGSYVVSLQAAQCGNSQPAGPQAIQVLLDGTVVGTITPSGTNYASYTTGPFTVTAGNHVLSFQGTTSGDSTAFLDQVAVGPTDGTSYFANIGWGDGNFSSGTITYNATSATFQVVGSHTYAEEGSYPVTTTIMHGAAPPATAFSSAQIGDASLSVVAQGSSGGVEGNLPATVTALLSDANPLASPADYMVMLNWGDGTITPATVGPAASPLQDGSFEAPVVGTGAFQYDPSGTPWTYSGQAGVAGNGSGFTSGNPNAPDGTQVAFLQGTGSVSQSIALPAGTYSLSFAAAQRGNGNQGGQAFQVLVDGSSVGTFTPGSPSYTAFTTSAFTVTAGSHTLTFIGLNPLGGDNTAFLDEVALNGTLFGIFGSHTYAEEGPHTVQVTVQDDGSSMASTSSTVTTADAPLTATGMPFTATAGQPFNGTVATLQDANFLGSAADFTATVNWGDGQSSPGQVMGGAGLYQVQGFHQYTQQGPHTVTVTIQDDGDASATTTTTVIVNDGSLVATGGSALIGTEGAPLVNQVVATFQDPGGAQPLPVAVSDAGFEQPSVGAGTFQYDPTGTAWTFSGGAGVAGNGSGFTSGNPNAPEGSQVAFLQNAGSSIRQTLAFDVAGSYVVSFAAAQRGNSQPAGPQIIQVLIDGIVVGTLTPTGTNYATYSTGPFTVTAGNHVLSFQGTTSGDSTAFLDQVAVGPADGSTSYFANIGWGDGNFSSGTITYNAISATFQVVGSHTYAEEGSYPVTTTIMHGAAPPATAFSSAQIGDASLSVVAQGSSGGVEGNLPATVTALLSDANPLASPADYMVMLNWGDGTITPATVGPAASPLQDGSFEAPVVGTGAFQYDPSGTPWTYSGQAGVAGNGSGFTSGNPNAPDGTQVAFLQGTGSVSQSITLPAGTYSLSFAAAQRGNGNQGGQTFQVLVDGSSVGTFTPSSPSYTAFTTSAFTVTAGSHTLTFIGLNPLGGDNTAFLDEVALNGTLFGIFGNHIYAEEGSYTVQVTVQDDGSSMASASSTVTIADAPLTATGMPFTATAGQPFNGTVATLQDSNFLGSATDFTATVNWGDGQSSPGQVMGGAGLYQVQGFHQYTQQGPHTVTVTIQDDGDASATTTTTVIVNDGSLVATGGSALIGTEGAPLVNQVVATFQDPGGAQPLPVAVSDAGFEQPSVGAGTFAAFQYDPSGTAWAFSGGAGVAGNGSGFTSGNPNAPAGSQVGFLQNAGSSIRQTLAFDVAGSYVVSFAAAQRGNSQPAGPQTIQVLLDGTVVGTITPSGTGYATYSTGPFTVTAGNHVLSFQGTTSGDSTAFLDQVAVGPTDGSTSYFATIGWGDGSFSTGTITYDATSATFQVLGSHTYTEEGSYPVTTTIMHGAVSPATAFSTAQIGDAALSVVTQGSGGIAGSIPATLTALLSDANPFATTADFAASINWGDGTITPATVGPAASPLQDGSFEAPVVGTSTFNAFQYDPSGTPWTYNGQAGVAGNGSGFTSGNPNAPDGTQVAFLQGTGSVSQSITLPAGTYSLSFVAAQRGNGNQGGQTFQVLVDGSSVGTFTPGSPSYTAFTTSTFTVTAGSHTLTFVGLNPLGGDNTAFVDEVALNGTLFEISGSHTYAEEGTYTAQVTVQDDGTSMASASSTVTITNVPLTATPGQPFTGTVATFDASSFGTGGTFTATINWGNGTTTTGIVTSSGGSLLVSGSNTYTTPGVQTVQVTITDGNGTTATASATVVVGDPSLPVTGAPVHDTEGKAFQGTVASFTDSRFAPGSSTTYQATIFWGDGSSSTGTVTGSGGSYQVHGDHTYHEEGSDTLSVVVTASDGRLGAGSTTATVADATLDANGTSNLSATEGESFSATVADVTDANPFATTADFTASIDWGDGTTSAGTVTENAGHFQVGGEHTYTEEGQYTVSVSVIDDGGSSAEASTSVSVADASITVNAQSISTIERVPFTGTVATITDANPFATADDFTATINWGDGTTGSGTVSGFNVMGSHTYADEKSTGDGSYSISVTVTDDGGASASGTATAGVGENPADPGSLTTVSTSSSSTTTLSIDVTADAFSATEAEVYSGTVADFSPHSGSEGPYTANIDWGDGTSSSGTVNGFSVSGTHSYADDGTYDVTVTVDGAAVTTGSSSTSSTSMTSGGDVDDGGSRVTHTTYTVTDSEGSGSKTITVADVDTLTATDTAFVALQGTEFSGSLGTFSTTYQANTGDDFTAVIDWGDGSSGTGDVTDLGNGRFSVTGEHIYEQVGTYGVAVAVQDTDGTAVAVAADLAVVLGVGNDATLVSVTDPVVSYDANATQTGHDGSGSFSVNAQGTVDYTVEFTGQDLYGAFTTTDSYSTTFSLTETGSATAAVLQLKTYRVTEDGTQDLDQQEQGFTRQGSFTQTETGDGDLSLTESADLTTGHYSVSQESDLSQDYAETGSALTGSYQWTGDSSVSATIADAGNIDTGDYSVTATYSDDASREESGQLVQYPAELSGTTADKTFAALPDALVQLTYLDGAIPNYATNPDNPGKAALLPEGAANGQAADYSLDETATTDTTVVDDGNTTTGDYSLTSDGSISYETSETGTYQAVGSFDLDQDGSMTATLDQTGNNDAGSWDATGDGSGTSTLTDSGDNQSSSYDRTVTDAPSFSQEQSGDNSGGDYSISVGTTNSPHSTETDVNQTSTSSVSDANSLTQQDISTGNFLSGDVSLAETTTLTDQATTSDSDETDAASLQNQSTTTTSLDETGNDQAGSYSLDVNQTASTGTQDTDTNEGDTSSASAGDTTSLTASETYDAGSGDYSTSQTSTDSTTSQDTNSDQSEQDSSSDQASSTLTLTLTGNVISGDYDSTQTSSGSDTMQGTDTNQSDTDSSTDTTTDQATVTSTGNVLTGTFSDQSNDRSSFSSTDQDSDQGATSSITTQGSSTDSGTDSEDDIDGEGSSTDTASDSFTTTEVDSNQGATSTILTVSSDTSTDTDNFDDETGQDSSSDVDTAHLSMTEMDSDQGATASITTISNTTTTDSGNDNADTGSDSGSSSDSFTITTTEYDANQGATAFITTYSSGTDSASDSGNDISTTDSASDTGTDYVSSTEMDSDQGATASITTVSNFTTRDSGNDNADTGSDSGSTSDSFTITTTEYDANQGATAFITTYNSGTDSASDSGNTISTTDSASDTGTDYVSSTEMDSDQGATASITTISNTTTTDSGNDNADTGSDSGSSSDSFTITTTEYDANQGATAFITTYSSGTDSASDSGNDISTTDSASDTGTDYVSSTEMDSDQGATASITTVSNFTTRDSGNDNADTGSDSGSTSDSFTITTTEYDANQGATAFITTYSSGTDSASDSGNDISTTDSASDTGTDYVSSTEMDSDQGATASITTVSNTTTTDSGNDNADTGSDSGSSSDSFTITTTEYDANQGATAFITTYNSGTDSASDSGNDISTTDSASDTGTDYVSSTEMDSDQGATASITTVSNTTTTDSGNDNADTGSDSGSSSDSFTITTTEYDANQGATAFITTYNSGTDSASDSGNDISTTDSASDTGTDYVSSTEMDSDQGATASITTVSNTTTTDSGNDNADTGSDSGSSSDSFTITTTEYDANQGATAFITTYNSGTDSASDSGNDISTTDSASDTGTDYVSSTEMDSDQGATASITTVSNFTTRDSGNDNADTGSDSGSSSDSFTITTTEYDANQGATAFITTYNSGTDSATDSGNDISTTDSASDTGTDYVSSTEMDSDQGATASITTVSNFTTRDSGTDNADTGSDSGSSSDSFTITTTEYDANQGATAFITTYSSGTDSASDSGNDISTTDSASDTGTDYVSSTEMDSDQGATASITTVSNTTTTDSGNDNADTGSDSGSSSDSFTITTTEYDANQGATAFITTYNSGTDSASDSGNDISTTDSASDTGTDYVSSTEMDSDQGATASITTVSNTTTTDSGNDNADTGSDSGSSSDSFTITTTEYDVNQGATAFITTYNSGTDSASDSGNDISTTDSASDTGTDYVSSTEMDSDQGATASITTVSNFTTRDSGTDNADTGSDSGSSSDSFTITTTEYDANQGATAFITTYSSGTDSASDSGNDISTTDSASDTGTDYVSSTEQFSNQGVTASITTISNNTNTENDTDNALSGQDSGTDTESYSVSQTETDSGQGVTASITTVSTGSDRVSDTDNTLTGQDSASDSASANTTMTEFDSYAATNTTANLTDVNTTTISDQDNGNDITGQFSETDQSSAHDSLQETGTNANGSFTLSNTGSDQESDQDTDNDITGAYQDSVANSGSSTAIESTTNGSGSAQFTETLSGTDSTTDTGDWLTGSDSETDSGTQTAQLVDSGTDTNGAYSVSDGSTDRFSDQESDNTVTGSYQESGSEAINYSMTESQGTPFSLQVNGSTTSTDTDTGNAVQGTDQQSQTGTDSSSMVETGANESGGFSETVVGSQSFSAQITDDPMVNTFQQTQSGTGTYTRTDSGAGADLSNGSVAVNYTRTESGDPDVGSFSATESGTDPYGLLQQFDNVSNTSSTSGPGNLDYSPIGRPFVDPGFELPSSVQEMISLGQAQLSLTPQERKAFDKLLPKVPDWLSENLTSSGLSAEAKAAYIREFLEQNDPQLAKQYQAERDRQAKIDQAEAQRQARQQAAVDRLQSKADALSDAEDEAQAAAAQAAKYQSDRQKWEQEALRQKGEMDASANETMKQLRKDAYEIETIVTPKWTIKRQKVKDEAKFQQLRRMEQIAAMGPGEKLAAAVQKMIDKGMLKGELLARAQALVSAESIATMGAIFAGWGVSHALGVGFAADAVMAVVGYALLGKTAIEVTEDLYFFVATAMNARTDADLERAAGHLSKAVGTVTQEVATLGAQKVAGHAASKVGEALSQLKGAPKPTVSPGGELAMAGGGAMRGRGLAKLRELGLGGVRLANKSFNAGKKALEEAGFREVPAPQGQSAGRTVFRNPKTGATVIHDTGDALVGNQQAHWHIEDSGAQRYDRSGRPVLRGEDAGHIPAAD